MRSLGRKRRELLLDLSQCGAEALAEYMRTRIGPGTRPGIVVSIATSGDLLQWHPHARVNRARLIGRDRFAIPGLDGQKAVLYRSKMNPRLGPKFEAMDPLEWLARMADHIPDAGKHRTHFYGFYASRARAVIRAPVDDEGQEVRAI